MSRFRLSDMPDWPAMLSRAEAAAYLGVSVSTFDDEVATGMWPAGVSRGKKGRKLTWNRAAIDQRLQGEEPGNDDGIGGFERRRAEAEASWRAACERKKR